MGKPERKIRERSESSRSYFLRCFGISRKIYSDKPNVETGQESKKKKKKTRISRWFSRSVKSRLNDGEKITPGKIYETEKRKSNVEDEKQNMFRVIRHETDQKINIGAIIYKTVEQETKEKYMDEQRDINPDPLSYLGYDTCHKEEQTTISSEKLDSTKTVGSRSKSKPSRSRKGSRIKNFDPLIGILIIMVTLMIMLMWGRLCAIICTSTWCYFLPRLKEVATAATAGKGKGIGGCKAEEDLNSEAYKKKVVLEGFLLRQRRV